MTLLCRISQRDIIYKNLIVFDNIFEWDFENTFEWECDSERSE